MILDLYFHSYSTMLYKVLWIVNHEINLLPTV